MNSTRKSTRENTRSRRFRQRFLILALPLLAAGANPLQAGTLEVPNGSFESPQTDFAGPDIAIWTKSPQPIWYNDPMFPWEQVTGQFLNTPEGSENRVDNMDGRQGAYIFALPDAALFQDFSTHSGSPAGVPRSLNAQFEAGKSYALTAAVLGGGGAMQEGATLEIALYYRDINSAMVTCASTTVTNSPALFPSNTHFTDFQVRIPQVKAGDAWAGKRIGIRLASTVGFEKLGGYWDVDNIRLTESALPNESFESPATEFAGPAMASWEKSPQPIWYNDPLFPWEQVMGQFLNTPEGSDNHIDNLEGSQGAYLFALPDVAISQDKIAIAGGGLGTEETFDATFEPGKSYALTAGILGGGGGMQEGATLQLRLYYRGAADAKVTVAAATVTNSPALFPTNTHFTDFQVRIPQVKAGDAWAGKNIGVELASTASFEKLGGYWDVDNIRLTESALPNESFESPATEFAGPAMASWEKSPQPIWYNDPMFPWEQVMGQFLNTPEGSDNRIDNMEGSQGAYLFALPDVAISQDKITIAGGGLGTEETFEATYEPGKSYVLNVGVLGGGGGMQEGATLQVRLYYRGAAGGKVTVASTTVTHSPALFPTNTHLTVFEVQVPVVKGREPWAGKPIGVELASTVGFEKLGGYWDVDNVRLREVEDPLLEGSETAGDAFQFTLRAAPGRYEVLAAASPEAAAQDWTSLVTVTNVTGTVTVIDPYGESGRRFYRARTAP